MIRKLPKIFNEKDYQNPELLEDVMIELKQAQNMQKEMMKIKSEIDSSEFVGESSFVKVTVNGKKEVVNVVIGENQLDSDDMEMLSELFMVATNNAMKQWGYWEEDV